MGQEDVNEDKGMGTKKKIGPPGATEQLRTIAALAKDWGSVPSTPTVAAHKCL